MWRPRMKSSSGAGHAASVLSCRKRSNMPGGALGESNLVACESRKVVKRLPNYTKGQTRASSKTEGQRRAEARPKKQPTVKATRPRAPSIPVVAPIRSHALTFGDLGRST